MDAELYVHCVCNLLSRWGCKATSRPSSPSPSRWVHLIGPLRARSFAPEFCARHRRDPADFTRQRLLTFPVVMLFLLQKTTRSVQRHWHSFLQQLGPQNPDGPVPPGGWTQARAKLSHTAFIALNQEVLRPGFYAPEQAAQRRLWRGHRLLGCDGSLLRRPVPPPIIKTFGAVAREDANPLRFHAGLLRRLVARRRGKERYTTGCSLTIVAHAEPEFRADR